MHYNWCMYSCYGNLEEAVAECSWNVNGLCWHWFYIPNLLEVERYTACIFVSILHLLSAPPKWRDRDFLKMFAGGCSNAIASLKKC